MTAGEEGRILSQGLEALGIELMPAMQQTLLAYLALLARWNRAYNLTAVRTPARMISYHLLDSLAVGPYVEGEAIIDVGTGAGLPGIPLAAIMPERRFLLLDSRGKKTRFVTQAVIELGLANVTVVQARGETYDPDHPFDTVVSRAFANLADMIPVTAHLCRPGGRLLAMGGRYPAAVVPAGFAWDTVAALTVPGVEGQRHAVCLRKAG